MVNIVVSMRASMCRCVVLVISMCGRCMCDAELCLSACSVGDDGFVPGEVDWMELLQVAKQHPGHYSLALMTA